MERSDPVLEIRRRETDSVVPTSPRECLKQLEINLTDLCNRRCDHCPHGGSEFPNVRNEMPRDVADRINQELTNEDWRSVTLRVSFAGFGEPLLHRTAIATIRRITVGLENKKVELITNGDRISEHVISDLRDAGVQRVLLNNYDGEDRARTYERIAADAREIEIRIRDNYVGLGKELSLNLTNRGGMLRSRGSKTFPVYRECYLPFYGVLLDYDGSVLLCGNDWARKSGLGLNVQTNTLTEIWNSLSLESVRRKLASADRSHPACRRCDIDGKLVGQRSFDYWVKVFAK